MRFLCLHGRGTNSDIFESQLAPLISRAWPEHVFDFIDAQFEGPAAPGIADIFPGPYFVWHKQHDPRSVESVHEYLDSVIEEDGPYDGLIGFSEGAALAASYLLSKEYRATLGDINEQPGNDIKLAICFNSIRPYSPSDELGSDATEEFQKELRRHSLFLKGQSESRRKSRIDEGHCAMLAERRTSIISQRRLSISAWKDQGMPGHRGSMSSATSGHDLDERDQIKTWNKLFSPVFCFDPDSFPSKIQIPTLHVIGAKDPFQEYSRELSRLCDPHQMEVAVVDVDHDIPRSGPGLDRIVDAFELITMMASVGAG